MNNNNILLVSDLLNIYNEEEREKLTQIFDLNVFESIISYDDVSNSRYFFSYLKKYPELKKQLLSELLSEENGIWVAEVNEICAAYFLVSNSHWKASNRKNPESVSLRLILIGIDSLPTIELNII